MKGALTWTLAGVAHRPWRVALAALAVAAGSALVALVLGFQRGFEASLADDVEALGYQLLVTGQGCPHEAATLILRGGAIPMYVTSAVADHVARQPEVAAATRFLLQAAPGLAPGETQLFVGADDAFLALKPGATFQRGGWFSALDAREVVAGYSVAEYRRIELGDEVDVRGEPHRVVGVLDRLGTQDDGTLFLPLLRAQEVFERRDRVTGIGLRLHDLEQAGPLIQRLYETPSLQVVRMSAVQETVLGVLRGVRALLTSLGVVALAAAGLGVLSAALLTQAERAGDLGILRAIGASRGLLFRLAWTDALAIGLLGAAFSAPLALALRGGAEEVVRRSLAFAPAGAVIAPGPRELALAALLGVAAALAAGLGPAWRAAARPPAETLRGGAAGSTGA
jgi:putative ABC transport system permease protein